MIGLDSNILLRAITADDPSQSRLARRLLDSLSDSSPGVINSIVLVEVAWTLRARHKYPKREILKHVESLMESSAYHVVDRDAVSEALEISSRHSIEFADALIAEINRFVGCATTMTFDEGAAKAPGFTQLR